MAAARGFPLQDRAGPAPLVALAIFLCSFATACATLPPPSEEDDLLGGELVTREDIERSGARTLWDVLRCCTSLRLYDGRDGRAIAADHRGSNSLFLSDTPLIYVDGIRASDIASLSSLSADDLLQVRILSAAEAMGRFGFGADNGVIDVRTRLNED